jgi:PST family polysaccharide transporter
VYWKFLYHTIYALSVLGGAFVGRHWGIAGVASAVTVATAVAYVLMSHLSLRLTSASWPAFFAAHAPGVAVSCAAAAIGLPVGAIIRSTGVAPLFGLAATTSACTLAAAASLLAVPDAWLTPTVRDVIGQVRKAASAKLEVRSPKLEVKRQS